MNSTQTKSKRTIAIEVLDGLFGREYVQGNRDRLLKALADKTGDQGILDVHAADSIFERFNDIFGRRA